MTRRRLTDGAKGCLFMLGVSFALSLGSMVFLIGGYELPKIQFEKEPKKNNKRS